MRRVSRWAAAVAALLCGTAAHAAPSFFTYQGRYLNAGLPANGNVPVEFRVTNGAPVACGTAGNALAGPVYWTSGSTSVYMSNGLFSYKIGYQRDGATADPAFVNVNWGAGTYYLDVCANGVELTPPDLIGSGPYSLFASTAGFATTVSGSFFASTLTWTGPQLFGGEVTVSTEAYFSAGRLNLGGNPAVNLPTPVNSGDAVNKAYVDAVAAPRQVLYATFGSFSANNYSVTSTTSDVVVVLNLAGDVTGGNALTVSLPAPAVGRVIKVVVIAGPAGGTDTVSLVGSVAGGFPCTITGLTSAGPGASSASWLELVGYAGGGGGWACSTK